MQSQGTCGQSLDTIIWSLSALECLWQKPDEIWMWRLRLSSGETVANSCIVTFLAWDPQSVAKLHVVCGCIGRRTNA